MTRCLLLALLCLGCGVAGPSPAPLPFSIDVPVLTAADVEVDTVGYMRVLAAEDRRAPTDADVSILTESLSSSVSGVSRAAVRALGRLERPELAEQLFEVAAESPSEHTRAEAANAVAQSIRAGSPGRRGALIDALLGRLTEESSPLVRAAVARSVARIPPADGSQAARVTDAVTRWGSTLTAADRTVELIAFARAASAHIRATQRAYPDHDLGDLVRELDDLLSNTDAVVRRTALTARRSAAAAPDDAWTASVMADDDPGVRREAMAWAGTRTSDFEGWPRAVLEAGLNDPAAEVRIAAVQGWDARAPAGERCAALLAAARNDEGRADPGDAVSLSALSAFDGSCPDRAAVVATMVEIVESIEDRPTDWARPVGALAVLARVDTAQTAGLLPVFSGHPNPFVREGAATAAGRIGAVDVLSALVGDADANVREGAIGAWGDDIPTAVLVSQLDRGEPHLLRTSALRLAGRTEPGLAAALLRALDRLSDPVHATMRDARLALLERVAEVGEATAAEEVRGYLTDPDPQVAALAQATLRSWGVAAATTQPTGLDPLPLPSFAELAAIEDSLAVVTMVGGAEFSVAVLPFEAPTNSARFLRMVRAGTFDGLTWHRVVSNFVVQGGSPGADEYAGHGAFTRDEVGLVGHFAGTVGISTRGRDTGDGQLFMNLVDNLRLDHDYTVFGYLADGFETVRAIRPGDVIERIRIEAR